MLVRLNVTQTHYYYYYYYYYYRTSVIYVA